MIQEAQKIIDEVTADLKSKYPILKNWSVKWNSRLRTVMGRAMRKGPEVFVDSKFIEFSSYLVDLNKDTPNFLERFRETVIHEWAHALDWEFDKGWSHGATWKRWMRTLGIPAERCYDSYKILCVPKGAKAVIRNKKTGDVFQYVKHITAPLLVDAFAWAVKKGFTPDEVDVIKFP